ncbi:MAG: hypothetical protein M3Y87_33480 [Myxococcota bacterium]|nr:hypothetical protein [Myxococcota bacterium]
MRTSCSLAAVLVLAGCTCAASHAPEDAAPEASIEPRALGACDDVATWDEPVDRHGLLGVTPELWCGNDRLDLIATFRFAAFTQDRWCLRVSRADGDTIAAGTIHEVEADAPAPRIAMRPGATLELEARYVDRDGLLVRAVAPALHGGLALRRFPRAELEIAGPIDALERGVVRIGERLIAPIDALVPGLIGATAEASDPPPGSAPILLVREGELLRVRFGLGDEGSWVVPARGGPDLLVPGALGVISGTTITWPAGAGSASLPGPVEQLADAALGALVIADGRVLVIHERSITELDVSALEPPLTLLDGGAIATRSEIAIVGGEWPEGAFVPVISARFPIPSELGVPLGVREDGSIVGTRGIASSPDRIGGPAFAPLPPELGVAIERASGYTMAVRTADGGTRIFRARAAAEHACD